MKKYVLTILPMIMISFLSEATIYQPNGETPATCDAFHLGVSEDEATSDMDASFRPNLINISWGNASVALRPTSTVNTYNSKIIKPSNEELPSKTGYKFVGWKVSGVKTCADFSSDENLCKEHQNCIWKDSTCIANPCVMCAFSMISDELDCWYQEYNYETNSCASLLQ